MTQAFSKVLVRQRPLLALAVIAALFAAAVAVTAPSQAADENDDVTWSIGLDVLDENGDGIIQAGDTPKLQIVLTASITPDSDDQAAGKKVEVSEDGRHDGAGGIDLSSGIEIGDSNDSNETLDTRLTIATSGIRFQPSVNVPNTQRIRVDDNHQPGDVDDFKAHDNGWSPSCGAGSKGTDSSGSTPAEVRCVITTNILVVIPQSTADGTYRISGNVEFAGGATVSFTDASGSKKTSLQRGAAHADRGTNSRVLPRAVSYNLVLGATPSIDSSKSGFAPANTCTNGVRGDTPGAKACATSFGVNAESEFELKIRNSAGRGVLAGQLATVVLTLIRDGEGGTPTFSMCGEETRTGSSCNPTLSSSQTASYIVRVKAPRTPGAATLRALVVPKAGDQLNVPISLTFIGPADDSKYEITEATSTVLNRDAGDDDADTTKDTARHIITLGLTTADSRDQSVPVPAGLVYEVMDPKGKKVAHDTIEATAGYKADTDADTDTNPDPDTSKVRIEVKDDAAPFQTTGEYTVNVKRGAKTVASTTFTVVGPTASPDGLTVTADTSDATTVGTEVPITISAVDADDNNVADGTPIEISVSDVDAGSGNVLVLSGANADGTVRKTTKNGRISANAIVVGAGRAVLTATVVGTDDDEAGTDLSQASAHEVLNLEAIAAVASASPTDDLSRTDLGQYTSWMGSETTTAAALFNQLARRGATALYLFNGSEWIQYATVGGQRIPGALDFTVKVGDTLFIGG